MCSLVANKLSFTLATNPCLPYVQINSHFIACNPIVFPVLLRTGKAGVGIKSIAHGSTIHSNGEVGCPSATDSEYCCGKAALKGLLNVQL